MANPPISRFQIWKLAARPHTLTASIVPVIVGYALTWQSIVHRNSGMLSEQRSRSCAAAVAAIADSKDGNSSYGGNACAVQYHDPRDITASASIDLLPLAVQFAIFACLIQISTNLHNDYADFVKGADTDERVGHARATQRGWLSPYETCRGCVLCLLGALLMGMHYLIPTYNQCVEGIGGADGLEYDPIMIFVVLSSLFNAVAYTGGPFPLGYIGLGDISIGYSGLGDLFVFVYFGIVATVGVPYLYLTKVACFSPTSNQTAISQRELQQLLYPSFLHSVPIGFLATAIIVVNNLRDRHTDIHAGKKTVAVRFGGKFAKIEYFILVVGSYGFCLYFWLLEREKDRGDDSKAWTALLPILSFPMAIPQLKAVAFGGKDGQSLNEHVGGTARLQMIYCILMTMGLSLS